MATAFHLDDQTLRQIHSYYEASKDYAFMLLPLVGVVRFSLALKDGVDEQVAVFKDVLICCVLLMMFGSFISFGMELPLKIAHVFQLGDVSVNVNPEAGNQFSIGVSVISRMATWAFYIIAKAIYYIALLIMCVLAAWVILGMTMTSFTAGFFVFVVVFLFICLIPSFWTLINVGTKLLLDAKDQDWNNGVLILSAAAKAWFTVYAFMKALYNPFLRSFTSAMGSVVGRGAQVAALASGAGGLAVGGVKALGGEGYISSTKETISSIKGFAAKNAAKTIPTAANLISKMGSMAHEKLKEKSPKAAETVTASAQYFRNGKNLYNGETLPGTSPFMQTFKNNKSFSMRSGNVTSVGASSSGSTPQPPSATPVSTPTASYVKKSTPKNNSEGYASERSFKTSSYSEAFGGVGNSSHASSNAFGSLGNSPPESSGHARGYISKKGDAGSDHNRAFGAVGNSTPTPGNAFGSLGNSPPEKVRKYSSAKFENKGFKK